MNLFDYIWLQIACTSSAMADLDKIRIQNLEDRSDYALWRIRVCASICVEGLNQVFTKEKKSPTSESSRAETSSRETNFEEKCQHARNNIVSALGDHVLHVVRVVIGETKLMMKKLNTRYDSNTIACRIAKSLELVFSGYSLKRDKEKQIDKLAGIIEQLRLMCASFDNALAIGILVASTKF